MADGSEVRVDAASSVGVQLEKGCSLPVGEIWREGTLGAAVHGETERRPGRRQRGQKFKDTFKIS
jgi:hypothetical protein